MENQQEEMERSGVLVGVASVLNAGGSAMVYVYDVSIGAFNKLLSVAKKTPGVPEKAIDMFVGGFGIIKPGESKKIEDKIRGYERKIKELYYHIGKEGAKYSGDESALETEPVRKLMADVREYEKEIERLKNRIVEIKEQKKSGALRRRQLRKAAPVAQKKERVDVARVKKAVGATIGKAVKQGEFESRSEMEIFDKVANDLLDNELEIKILAVAELGKIGNNAALPILLEAVNFDRSDLTSEIINSLIMIGDVQAVPLFKKKATDPKYRVRIGCLRGLYKLATDEEAMPMLIEALRDGHQDVRRTAATFIGWKDYADAAPALVQCLRDEDAKVRKATVSAVANLKDEATVLPLINLLRDKDIEIREKALEAIGLISGEEITFDVQLSGSALTEEINKLRDWWQKERLSKIEVPEAEEAVEPDTELEAVSVPEVEEEMEEPEEVAAEAEPVEETKAPEEVAAEAEPVEETEEPEEVAAEAETDKPEEAAPERSELTEENLKKLLKSELLSYCQQYDIETDSTTTKAQMIDLILGD